MNPPLSSPAGTFRWMFRLSLPVLAEELLNLTVGYTDWWLAGRFLPGAEYKAAMGLMAYITWLIPCLFAAIAIGATAMASRAIGATNHQRACLVTNQAMLLGAALALIVTVAVALWSPSLVSLMQLEGEAARLAITYISILTIAIPAIMVEQVASACLRGAGDTVSGFLAKAVVNVINVTVSATLVTGAGPFPKLGWSGLAIGTATGHIVGGSILLILLLRGRVGLRLRRQQLRPHPGIISQLLRIGLPGGVDVLLTLTCHLTYVSVINSMGTLAAAAHGLGVQIEALAYLPGSAFQVAAATMAGQFLGARNSSGAQRAVMTACGVGMIVTCTAGLAFFFGGHYLTTAFTGDWNDETGQTAAGLLRIVALSMPSLAIVMIVTGGLRGAGDTRWPMLFSLVGFVGIRIPGACLLAWDTIQIPFSEISISGWGMGVAGAWWAMLGDVVVRSILVLFRFFHGGWRKLDEPTVETTVNATEVDQGLSL